jgi:hypothetical protein
MVVKDAQREPRVRINTIVDGEPAQWLLTWKRRGLVRSNSDAIRQAFRCFNEKLLELDNKQPPSSARTRFDRREEGS